MELLTAHKAGMNSHKTVQVLIYINLLFLFVFSLFVFYIYRKIPKISPGAYIFQRPFLRGLSMEGNLRFKIDWASLMFGRKSTVFAFFYFVFEGKFPITSPRGRGGGAYIWRGDLTDGFCITSLGGLYMEGLIFGILRYNNLLCMKIGGKKRCKKGATNKNLILVQD